MWLMCSLKVTYSISKLWYKIYYVVVTHTHCVVYIKLSLSISSGITLFRGVSLILFKKNLVWNIVYSLIIFIQFDTGGKITKVSGECVKIIDSSGHSTVLENEKDEHSVPASTKLLWDHFQQVQFMPFVIK